MTTPERLSPDELQRRLRTMTRRSFGVGAAAGALGLLGFAAIRAANLSDGTPWPLRRVLEFNEALARATFSPARLAPQFARRHAADPRANGRYGLQEEPDVAGWKLELQAAGQATKSFDLAVVRRLPRVEQTTELKCIEGWSQVVHWAGARLSDFLVAHAPQAAFRNVQLLTPDGGYYVGLDRESALHPQTLLCYEMNGRSLTAAHGAPLRLVIPVKYGIKNIKRIGKIVLTDERPTDFWFERGYDWYAGL